jgi:hypothetical protein
MKRAAESNTIGESDTRSSLRVVTYHCHNAAKFDARAALLTYKIRYCKRFFLIDSVKLLNP